jgi:hypothetical protein
MFLDEGKDLQLFTSLAELEKGIEDYEGECATKPLQDRKASAGEGVIWKRDSASAGPKIAMNNTVYRYVYHHSYKAENTDIQMSIELEYPDR